MHPSMLSCFCPFVAFEGTSEGRRGNGSSNSNLGFIRVQSTKIFVMCERETTAAMGAYVGSWTVREE